MLSYLYQLFFLIFLITAQQATAQRQAVNSLKGVSLPDTHKVRLPGFQIDSLSPQGVLLDKGWKFHTGDNPAWAKADFDDSQWEAIIPGKDVYFLPQIQKQAVGWLRIRVVVDSALVNKALAFQIKQTAASEIFLNGKLVQSYGIVSQQPDKIEAFDPVEEPAGLLFDAKQQTIAIRFSIQNNLPYFSFNDPFQFFRFRVREVKDTDRFNQIRKVFNYLNFIYCGFFLLLSIIHLGFYLTFSKQKANLYFSLFALATSIANILYVYIVRQHSVTVKVYAGIIDYLFLFSFFSIPLFLAISYLFSRPKKLYDWFLISYLLFGFVLSFYIYEWGVIVAFLVPHFLTNIQSFRVALSAYLQHKRGAGLLVFGIGSQIILYFGFILTIYGLLPSPYIGYGFMLGDVFYHLSFVCISLSFSAYLGKDFAFTSKDLGEKVIEIEKLATEKQQLLTQQNEMLERQVTDRTAQLNQSLTDLKITQNQLVQKEKLASLGELTAGIAHEIQNPLNFVNNFSEVSAELLGELEEEQQRHNRDAKLEAELLGSLKENLKKISLHGGRASNIVRSMLEHARTSTGQRQPTDINALADEYLRLAYHGLRAKGKSFNAELVTDFDPDLGRVDVVPQDIGRVLLNLFNNAFYATQQRAKQGEAGYAPTLTISTRLRKSDSLNRPDRAISPAQSTGLGKYNVEIRVKDNGVGIPDDVKAKIFQPFFTTKPTGEGTGLGLSLSYDIVTKGHGGTLDVVSKEGEGTEFIVTI